MKLLLDECVDRRLAKSIEGHSVKTVPQMGWQAYKNGVLLKEAQSKFDVLITVDRNLYFQQSLKNLDIIVLVLCGKTNRLKDLLPLISKIHSTLKKPTPGKIYFLK